MNFLSSAFFIIDGLRSSPKGEGTEKDFRHAVEELGEIAKALRAISNSNSTEETAAAKENLREEIVDVAICCLAMFLGAQENKEDNISENFRDLFFRKLQKWENQVQKSVLP